ncbi:putative ribonuclease H-like domain-containing protein [Tanacetum coccineum]|uniref:Ribonuclease H-like domain-containing protein n=1 Tax=Tanacetum coccineum TaxID=301880 RepID=A0ABQ5APU0_9ASTR
MTIGTMWVFRNKRDERSIVMKNKARLVAQGHRQEEGINYDEVFAPVTRIEAIRLFLSFASYMGFLVYQMDVKSAFLYGIIEEEVYVHQPPGFVNPAHPNKVYRMVKALYGLHQAPRAWYETLSSFLLENGFRSGTIDKTLFIKKNKSDIMLVQVYVDDIIFGSTKKSMCTEFEELLVKDKDGVEVDVHEYRSMIASLMYLTASRPDIMFAVYACARFQVTPKASHLHDVKRIFRYLKHQPKLGLWYPRDSPFKLKAFSDSDYAGASLNRKSTTGRCQFLGRRLISWQCKKKTIMANSTTKAEYVAAAHCCGDCYEKRLIDVLKIHTDSNVADLLTKGFDVTSIKVNSGSLQVNSGGLLVNSVDLKLILMTVGADSKEYTITEASVRSNLQLADATGIHNLSDAKIYVGLATLGYVTEGDIVPLLPAMLAGAAVDQGEGSAQPAEPHHTPVDPISSTSQPPIQSPPHSPPHSPHQSPPFSPPHYSPPRSYEAPLPEGNTLGSAEDIMQLKELMDIVPGLVTRIETLETELQQTKTTYGNAVLTLVKRGEEPEDQGRIIQDIDDDPLVSLGGLRRRYQSYNLGAAKTLLKVASQGVSKVKSTDKGKRYRRRARSVAKNINTGLDAEEEINTGRVEINTGIEEVSTGSAKVDSGTASKRGQREGKAPMVEEDIQATHKTKEQIRQEEAGLEEAIKLQAQMDEEVAKQIHLDELIAKRMAEEEALSEQQKKRKAQVQFEAQYYTEEDWDAIRAKQMQSAELTKDVLGKDVPEQDFAKRMVDMVNQRKKHFAEERAKAKRNKPMTQSQEKVAEVKEEEPVKRTGKRKKQKARKGISIDKNAQGDSETDKEESVEAMNPTPLATKSNIVVNWKIFQQGQRSVYQIMRANGADTVYMSFGAMIKDFTREDLIELYRLVMQKYGTNRPENAYDRVLWSDLRTMFDPPLNEDAIWSLPLQQKMISWRYYDKCAVHCLTLEASSIYMLADRKYPLSKDACQVMLKMKLLDGTMDEYCTKALATPEQTATGKEISNPLIADSLLKTISCEEKTETKRQNHNLWDVIVNGDLEEEHAPTTGETSTPPASKTAKQLAA